MLRKTVSALAYASFAVANSFRDASPFLFFSSSEILSASPQITTAQSLTSIIESELSKCPTDNYVFAHQDGVSADDFGDSHTTVFPIIHDYLSGKDKRIRSAMSVSQVVGDIDASDLKDLLQVRCGAGSMHLDARMGTFDLADEARPRIITIQLEEMPLDDGRGASAHVNEMYLQTMLDSLPTDNFTVIYTTSPKGAGSVTRHRMVQHDNSEDVQYEMDHINGFVHMELKRDVKGNLMTRVGDGVNNTYNGPLFEKYAYLSPGLFMGLFVSLILLSILYVGLSALSSMEVSYAAFDKENGPQAQRKQ